MDKKVANNVVVGIFITVAFIAVVWVIFNIGGGTGILSSQYSLFGRFIHVKGLHQGSEVTLAGLRIGTVKTITITPDSKKELIVEFAINKKMKERIRQDSVAKIMTQGMLGDKYIELTIGLQGEPLEAGAFIPTEEPADLFTKGGDMVEGITKQFKGGDIEVLLKNLATLSINLANISSQVQKERGLLHELIYGDSGKSLSKSMQHIENILAKVDRGDGTIGSLVNDPTVYEDIKHMMGGAKRSSVLRYYMREFIDEGAKEATKKK
jgi:phospholipid/cholesterol/gamma-HCH transport system substrate-binding protein